MESEQPVSHRIINVEQVDQNSVEITTEAGTKLVLTGEPFPNGQAPFFIDTNLDGSKVLKLWSEAGELTHYVSSVGGDVDPETNMQPALGLSPIRESWPTMTHDRMAALDFTPEPFKLNLVDHAGNNIFTWDEPTKPRPDKVLIVGAGSHGYAADIHHLLNSVTIATVGGTVIEGSNDQLNWEVVERGAMNNMKFIEDPWLVSKADNTLFSSLIHNRYTPKHTTYANKTKTTTAQVKRKAQKNKRRKK